MSGRFVRLGMARVTEVIAMRCLRYVKGLNGRMDADYTDTLHRDFAASDRTLQMLDVMSRRGLFQRSYLEL